ncbi:MAG: TetR/AcrR family transcriptional regulator [Lentisphaeria bacterium]|nr:TetR/AcrR family transcriptional regulator [Lentisphaeria bacterium]
MPRYNQEKREQLAEQMRTTIVEAYVRLADRNINISMESLAAEVGIAKGTLYLYFKTKDELQRAALAEGRKRMLERMMQTLNSPLSAPEKLCEFVRWMMEEFCRHRLLRMEYLRNNNQPPLPRNVVAIEILTKIIQQGVDEKDFRDVNVADTVFLIRSSIIGQFVFLLRDEKELDLERAMFMFKDITLRGILRNQA